MDRSLSRINFHPHKHVISSLADMSVNNDVWRPVSTKIKNKLLNLIHQDLRVQIEKLRKGIREKERELEKSERYKR